MPYVSPWGGEGIKTRRRYYLLKARAIEAGDEEPNADVFRHKQQTIVGTALPSDFPHLARLTGCDYSTYDDLDGASEKELTSIGFSTTDARAVLAAFAELLTM